MSDDLKWEEPPARTRGGANGFWAEVAAVLTARPGEWAMVRECVSINGATQMAKNLRSGVIVSFQRGKFETRSHTPTGGPFKVYARYIGEPKP